MNAPVCWFGEYTIPPPIVREKAHGQLPHSILEVQSAHSHGISDAADKPRGRALCSVHRRQAGRALCAAAAAPTFGYMKPGHPLLIFHKSRKWAGLGYVVGSPINVVWFDSNNCSNSGRLKSSPSLSAGCSR